MAKEYDLVIVGGGTGGYVAAIRASQLGLKLHLLKKKILVVLVYTKDVFLVKPFYVVRKYTQLLKKAKSSELLQVM